MSDEQRKYTDGEGVFREGQRSSKAFIVVSGRIELLKSSGAGAPVRLSILGPGEMFGEMGVVNRAPAKAA